MLSRPPAAATAGYAPSATFKGAREAHLHPVSVCCADVACAVAAGACLLPRVGGRSAVARHDSLARHADPCGDLLTDVALGDGLYSRHR